MNSKKLLLSLFLIGLFGLSFSTAFGQATVADENTDLWRVRGMAAPYGLPNAGVWHGDSLFVGATFMRDTTKRFIVWLANYYIPQGSYHGALYLMIPRPGLPDSALFLFYNKCQNPATAPTVVDLTNITPTIHHLDTLFFMYRSWEENSGGSACGNYHPLTIGLNVKQDDSLFTGPNRAPGEGWLNLDRHYSARNENALVNPPIPKTFPVPGSNPLRNAAYGRRWCEAAWVHTVPGGNVRTDTVEFGFEDQFNGADINYEDIRFNVTGVFLIHPVILDSLHLDLFSKDTIAAGDSAIGFAVISGRDSLGKFFRDSTKLANSVIWDLRKTPQSKSVLSKGIGPTNTNVFRAVTAYEWDTITVQYTDPKTSKTFSARRAIFVKPGPDYRVWIEPDANINPALISNAQMLARLQNPDHVALIQMTSAQIVDTVVGVVRDMYGNFTHLATTSQWSEVPPTDTLVNPVNGVPPYLGVINRKTSDSGSTKIQVSVTSLVPDTTPVSLLLGYIIKIKFVNAADGSDLTSVNINTDQDITIKVMGVLSTDPDPNHYVDITGLWTWQGGSDVFASDFPLPTGNAGQWHFSPAKPGGPTNLVVTTGTGTTLRTATLPITVTPAPPSKVVFTIITPPDSIIAGVPILGVVSIYNKDGLVPGPYCYQGAIYQDSLGKGATRDPTVTTKQTASGIINQAPDTTNKVGECFSNGIDTVSFILYRAPHREITDTRDTLHQLVVLLSGLSATTVPFKVNPGPLYRLQIENARGQHIIGPDTLAFPQGAITVYSVGYDQFGNKRGREVSNWSVTNTLHQPQVNTGASLYYDASQVTSNEDGLLIARALRSAVLNDSAGDSLAFHIQGPPSALDSAVTRDVNGNGYLDEIELYFSKEISFPSGFSLTDFTIIYTSTVNNRVVNVPFTVISMDTVAGSGTKFVLHLAENTSSLPGSPQTAWKPYISIAGIATPVPATQCRDGAGPVIWSVVKTIVNVSDRKQDVVRVTFSEPIQGPNGSQFSPASEVPQVVLNVYRKNTAGGYDVINSFDSIPAFSRNINDSTLEFMMSNGKDLTTADFLNINASANQVYDGRSRSGGGVGVPPVTDNQKVQVKILNATPNKIVAVPNPSGPIFTHVSAYGHNFSFANNPLARTWVREDHAGTVITFDLSPPKSAGESIDALIKIFDVVGNVVNQADTVINYFPGLDTTTTIQYNTYWNGANSRGMRVAPGLYSTAVYLTYHSPTISQKPIKLWGVIGISK